ncbi:hypothetical protein BDR05DRAFT_762211 [Suillus weaverae]|nr:hypothetical protein BDR05DRAFT_762211 [Suillus weaverae]
MSHSSPNLLVHYPSRITLMAQFPQAVSLCSPFGNHFNDELTRDGRPIAKSIFRVGCAILVKNGEPPHAPPKEYIQDLIDIYGIDTYGPIDQLVGRHVSEPIQPSPTAPSRLLALQFS